MKKGVFRCQLQKHEGANSNFSIRCDKTDDSALRANILGAGILVQKFLVGVNMPKSSSITGQALRVTEGSKGP